MSTTFRNARQFGIAALVGLAATVVVSVLTTLCGASPDPRVEFPKEYYPTYLVAFVTALLALVTSCLVVAGVVERLLGRGRRNAEPSAPPNGGPTAPVGNSGVAEGPPSVS
jgi:hypothetical protein